MRAVPGGGATDAIARYMTEKTGARFETGKYSAMAILSDEGEFVGGVIFSNFRGTDVEISCAADTPLAFRDGVPAAVFTYVFKQLGCVRCSSITTRANKRARGFLTSLGFVLEGNIRLGYDGRRDALVYGLLASECRFIGAGGLTNVGAANTDGSAPDAGA